MARRCEVADCRGGERGERGILPCATEWPCACPYVEMNSRERAHHIACDGVGGEKTCVCPCDVWTLHCCIPTQNSV